MSIMSSTEGSQGKPFISEENWKKIDPQFAKERCKKQIEVAIQKKMGDVKIEVLKDSELIELKDYFWNNHFVYFFSQEYNHTLSLEYTDNIGKRKKAINNNKEVNTVFNKILNLAKKELSENKEGVFPLKFTENELLPYQYPAVLREVSEQIEGGKILMKNGLWNVAITKPLEAKSS